MQRLREKRSNEDTKNAMKTELEELCDQINERCQSLMAEFYDRAGFIIFTAIRKEESSAQMMCQSNIPIDVAVNLIQKSVEKLKQAEANNEN
jgi:chorismate mutase